MRYRAADLHLFLHMHKAASLMTRLIFLGTKFSGLAGILKYVFSPHPNCLTLKTSAQYLFGLFCCKQLCLYRDICLWFCRASTWHSDEQHQYLSLNVQGNRLICKDGMSRFARRPVFCTCENKGTDKLRSNCTVDQHLCFRYIDGTIPLPKSEISSL